MKKKKILVLSSCSPWNEKLGVITQFHVVVVRRRKRKFTKRATHVVVLLIRPIAFLSFSLPSPSSFLKLPKIPKETVFKNNLYFLIGWTHEKWLESLTLKTISGKLSHLEWQEKWSCAHLCRIMRLKKADSASLNDTAGECLIHLFKHLAKLSRT